MSDWKSFYVEQLGKIITGKTPKTSNVEYYGGDIPFLTPSDDMSVKHVIETKRSLSDLGKSTVKNLCLPKNSVCVSCIGSDLGKVVITGRETVSNQQINSIIVDEKFFDVDFVYYSMVILGKKLKYLSHTSTAVPIINKSTFSKFTISCPPLETQKKIAAVLSALDDKIELNNAINRNLEEQAQAIYKKICLRAKLAPLSELIEIVESGSRPKGGATTSGIPSIGAEKIDGFGRYDYSNEKFIDTDYFKRLKRGIVFSGDVMLYKDGAYTGKSSMALDGFPHEICAVNEHVFLLRTKDSRAQFFLYFTLRNEDVYKKIHVLACGKAAQPGLNQKELMCVTSFLPEEEVIQKFESVVSPMMHSIALNALENKKLGDVRDSLLPRLMSGEIDVSAVEI